MSRVLERPTALLRILWVDDDVEDVDGFGEDLQGVGHDVTYASTVEEAEELLKDQPFDVIIVDQQMHDADKAGTELVGALKDGELGEINQAAGFMFFTGSLEWVRSAKRDVKALPGYLGMEEKGQIVDDFLDGNLRRVTINPYGNAVDRPPTSPPASVTTRPAPTNAEYWAGTVMATSTETGRFRVRLEADGKPAYEVDFPVSRLAPDALSHLRVGAQVELEINAFDENASRTIDSTLTLAPAPAPDGAARDAARQRALQRRQQAT